ncbi:MAG TPA: ATP-binding protein [archaeon]|nr:ATP-binding protein [archaeon]
METEQIKRVIESQREEVDEKFSKEEILEREGLDVAKRYLSAPNVLVVLGIRRSGKSIFSLLLARELKQKAAYINFVDERLISMKTEDLERVLEAFYELYGDVEFIILDEIQQVHGWEMFANRLRRTKKVIVTGSDSKLLSGELATHLTGRHIDFTLYPFSFKEIAGDKTNIYSTREIARAKNELKKYAEGSGLPEFYKFGREIVREIYGDILTKDCVQRHGIREEKSFRELAGYLVSNFSSEFTYSKLAKIVGLKDINTAKNYVHYLQEAYMIAVIERYSAKLKQQIIAPKKAYCIDQGFCNFVSFNISKNQGRVYENIVCIELLREKAKNPGLEVYYWKNHQQNEVDFVTKEGSKVKELIQVCYNPIDEIVRERETKPLIKAAQELKCKNLRIITSDYEATHKKGKYKIQYTPLWKWLLGKA